MKELTSPIYLDTPLGPAVAYFVDAAGHDGMEWGCLLTKTGELWWWPNRQVRLHKSVSDYRYKQSPIMQDEACIDALAPHLARQQRG